MNPWATRYGASRPVPQPMSPISVPVPAVVHQLAEETEHGPLDRHLVEDAGEPLGVELREDVVGSAQLVGPWVHDRDPRTTASAECGSLRGEPGDPVPVAGGERVGRGEPGAADAADVRQREVRRRRWPSVIPPVGQKRAAGTGAPTAFRKAVPPDAAAGKNFISVQPASSAASTSETVAVPGRNGSPVSCIACSS